MTKKTDTSWFRRLGGMLGKEWHLVPKRFDRWDAGPVLLGAAVLGACLALWELLGTPSGGIEFWYDLSVTVSLISCGLGALLWRYLRAHRIPRVVLGLAVLASGGLCLSTWTLVLRSAGDLPEWWDIPSGLWFALATLVTMALGWYWLSRPGVDDLIARLPDDLTTGKSPYADASPDGTGAAVTLATIGQPAVEPLIEALPRSSSAHEALGMIGGEKAFQALCGELSTENPARVRAAASALGRLGDPRALELLEPLKASEDPDVRSVAAFAITEIAAASGGEAPGGAGEGAGELPGGLGADELLEEFIRSGAVDAQVEQVFREFIRDAREDGWPEEELREAFRSFARGYLRG